MLTILTLEILSGKRSSKDNVDKFREEIHGNIVFDKTKEEQIRKEKNDRIENFIMLLPIIVMLLGILIMYILEKIFM